MRKRASWGNKTVEERVIVSTKGQFFKVWSLNLRAEWKIWACIRAITWSWVAVETRVVKLTRNCLTCRKWEKAFTRSSIKCKRKQRSLKRNQRFETRDPKSKCRVDWEDEVKFGRVEWRKGITSFSFTGKRVKDRINSKQIGERTRYLSIKEWVS